ncbi:hypothetical protein LOZ39_004513 [Ophidiomyces ophidiicola]|uniref:Uncharacterized protein n=1 Tax=Ophidiomyces ophidiicola TaxID=1387563 RepID=A0ACB8V1U3_9EURO|nr:uncharacterized protein LOZ57_003487 [Ophidiomyces ophidiicola]KAI1909150.1 hypothetical protein LOZ61_005188 [Ophidiomyces ophidiicola]KAI1911417.1 hypothetical protein LOZ64_004746 [Ophidiomyces ophidiicola]KAI1930971.1 hypothetical protein LOZ60_000631 [Ophidiomyces ophidiicola]KAI1946717.1 hypothetical protein LOZ57_003487 [Ophidiomyces ophidiicola]KAI1954396.1 hypothetical protein LOZ59_004920 [Ophidiomyces ophidiicola]
MDPYDSDSSGLDDEARGEYTTTSVLLGYVEEEATDDAISHLGGLPTWLDPSTPPPGNFAKCKSCNDPMPLLLQLHADLPEHFPNDERWLYIFGCTRRTCSRKQGSIRALRGVRKHKIASGSKKKGKEQEKKEKNAQIPGPPAPKQDIGSSLFGVAPGAGQGISANANPFSTTSSSPAPPANPFAQIFSPSTLAALPPQKPVDDEDEDDDANNKQDSLKRDNLPQSFAEKVRLSPSSSAQQPPQAMGPVEPWPAESSFPAPYPQYFLDAEYETLSRPSTPNVPTNVQVSSLEDEEGPSLSSSSAAAEGKDTFESSLDKSFLKFSTRLDHNPEQVLRYEFRGTPLLYSTTDPVGKLLAPPAAAAAVQATSHVKVASSPLASGVSSRLPRCGACGRERVFEVQLVPYAISVLEEGREGIGIGKDEGGMEWGTVIVGVCAANCGLDREGELGWREEWVGVQWEERVGGK